MGTEGRPDLVKERASGTPMSAHALVMVVVLALLAGAMAGTQKLAGAFAYHPRLGAPLVSLPDGQRTWAGWAAAALCLLAVRMVFDARTRARAPVIVVAVLLIVALAAGPVYHPSRILEWWPQIRGRDEFRLLRRQAAQLGFTVGGLVGVGMYLAARPARTKAASVSHGSAEWGTGDEFKATPQEVRAVAEATGLRKLILGRHDDGTLLVEKQAGGHLLTMAATRAGKGIGTVIPNALGYAGSMLFTDVKGEIFAVTARHRRTRLGHTIYCFDPFEVTLREGAYRHDMRAFFNPMRLIPTVGPQARLALDRARSLSEALITQSEGDNKFWDQMALQVATGFIIYIGYQFDCGCTPQNAFPVATPFGRDLLSLRFLTTLDGEQFKEVLAHMHDSPHPEVRRVGNILGGADERTRQNIMTSLQSQLAFLDSPQMAAVLAEMVPEGPKISRPNPLPHADIDQIKGKGVRQTLYLVIPPAFLETHAAWMRLMIVSVNEIVQRTTRAPDVPIVAMLDEFGNLGRIDAVRRAVTLAAGYGIRYWLIVQDLSQVENLYGKGWGTLFANADTKQLSGTNDLRTAKELSELTGDATVYSDSGNSGKTLDSAGWVGKGLSVGESYSEKGRKLLLPDEVLGMPRSKQLLLVRGHRVMFLDKLNYLTMPEVQGLADANPMY